MISNSCNTANCLLMRILHGEHESLVERKFCQSTGSQLTCIVNARPYYNSFGQIVGIIQELTDVTKLKRAESALNDTKVKFERYIEKSPDGIFVVNGQGDYVDVNPRGCYMLGYTKEELLKMNIRDISLPNDGAMHFKKLKQTGEITEERYLLKKDGTRVPVELKGVSLGNDLYMAYARDISERKQFENALRKSEEQYRVIFDNSPLGVFHFNQVGVITHSNERVIEILGSTREKIIGFNMLTDVHNVEMKFALETALAGRVGYYEGNYTSVTGGKNIYLKALFNRITSETGEFLGGVAIYEDLTEKKNFEKELARLDTLNMVGQIASSIGHEVRNPMTTVKGFLRLLANKETEDKKKEYYDLMVDEINRANSIITEFLTLARDRRVEMQPASLNVIINALFPLLSADATEHDKRIIHNKGDIPNIPFSEKEIRQLILNLVRNALEATPLKGVVTISTYVGDGDVVLSVEDEGTGIPPEIQEKIGRPFITTKDNGTGLGLSICYSIAHKHGAKIDYKTGSAGTSFYVRFKIHQKQIQG